MFTLVFTGIPLFCRKLFLLNYHLLRRHTVNLMTYPRNDKYWHYRLELIRLPIDRSSTRHSDLLDPPGTFPLVDDRLILVRAWSQTIELRISPKVIYSSEIIFSRKTQFSCHSNTPCYPIFVDGTSVNVNSISCKKGYTYYLVSIPKPKIK